jgi:hypothetical protein
METKTSGLTKLMIIVESAFLVISLAVFYILKNTQELLFAPGLYWLWGAIMVFSAASFLFLFVIFIITLAKRNLRTTFFLPLLFIGFIVFLVVSLIMFLGPSVMQPVIMDYPDQEVVVESEIVEEAESSQVEEKSGSQQVETEKTSEPAEMTIYNVGDLAEAGELAIRVNSLRTAEKEDWDEQTDEGYHYLLVDISLENTGSQEMYIDTYSNFRLVGKDGRNFEPVWPMLAEGKIEGLLGPGRKIAGEVAYAVPADLKEFELEIFEPTQGMISNKMAVFSIVLE